ncbi:MAG: hypothetical protein PHO42_05595, partial [Candidatus Omnitrophica bacterium]|nr:hypothetical protein [Candidatus Omnitrophota bacterium]
NFGFRADFSKNADLVAKMNGKKEIEVDFTIIANGIITIGECKQNAADFTDEIVNNLLTFAEYVECDKIIFSSIDNLSSLKERIAKLKIPHDLKIEIMDENDLLYITAYLAGQIDRNERYERMGKGEKNLKDLNIRRQEFIEQFTMIEKDKSRPREILGNYFHLF